MVVILTVGLLLLWFFSDLWQFLEPKISAKPLPSFSYLNTLITTSKNWDNVNLDTVSQWSKAVFPAGTQTLLRRRNDERVELEVEPNATRRQREFAEGRACARTLLDRFGNWEEVGVAEDRSPIWPHGFTGSISHSNSWVWTAVAESDNAASLGIDTEVIVTRKTRNLLYDDIVTEQERMIIQSLGLSAELTFTLAFSAKEAFFKCWYPITKEFFGFRQAAIQSCDENKVRIVSLVSNPNFKLTPNWLDVHYLATDNDVFTATWMEQQG